MVRGAASRRLAAATRRGHDLHGLYRPTPVGGCVIALYRRFRPGHWSVGHARRPTGAGRVVLLHARLCRSAPVEPAVGVAQARATPALPSAGAGLGLAAPVADAAARSTVLARL